MPFVEVHVWRGYCILFNEKVDVNYNVIKQFACSVYKTNSDVITKFAEYFIGKINMEEKLN